MAKLIYKYGSMGASKTANALMTKYNFEEKGITVELFKPEIDTRDGEEFVKSRIGLKSIAKTVPINCDDNFFFNMFKDDIVKNIIIDECQFLTEKNVKDLCNVVDNLDINVWCYGLKTDFMGELFEGSEALLRFADTIEEIKTSCFCGKKAIMNARIVDGVIIKNGEQIQLGGNDTYTSLCRKHWTSGQYEKHSVFKKKNIDEYDGEE